jgi:DNA-binding MarR family transcriptional regulator
MDQSLPDGNPPPHDVSKAGPSNSVGFSLSQVGLETVRQFGNVVGALGLEPRHFAVLHAVHWDEGQFQQVIGDQLAIPASTMVAIVDHLEGASLLERRLRSSDRRTRALHLTTRGETLLSDALAAAMAQEDRICAGLESGERTQLLALLRRVSTNLGVPFSALPDRGSGDRPDHF